MCVCCQWRLSEDNWGFKWINEAFSHCSGLMERFCCNATLNLLLKDIKNKYLALSKQYNQNTLTLTPLLLTCVLWASSTIMSFYNPMYFILFIFTLCQIAIDKPTCLLTHLFSSWAAPSSSDCGLTFSFLGKWASDAQLWKQISKEIIFSIKNVWIQSLFWKYNFLDTLL